MIFCDALGALLQNLKAQLDGATASGYADDPTVVSAQAVYDAVDRNNTWGVYIPGIGNSCQADTQEVQNAINRMRQVVDVSLPRPDVQPPAEGLLGEGSWVKYAIFGVIGVAGLHYIVPLFSSGRQRKTAGYRRKRSRR